MFILNCAQRSEEWYLAKLGVPSASRFSDIMTPVKRQYAERSAHSYMNELIQELLTGEYDMKKYQSEDVDHGIEYEDEARRYYEWRICNTTQVGLIYSNDKKDELCSPDSLIKRKKRGLEIKCPKLTTMIEIIAQNSIPDGHLAQVQGSMMITDYKTWDFLPYHPLIPEPPIITVKRDEAYIAQLRRCLIRFKIEMAERLELVLKTGATLA